IPRGAGVRPLPEREVSSSSPSSSKRAVARQKKYEWISERSVSQQGLGVLYHVAIALLGEKELAIGGEILVARVTGDDGVEVCQASITFGAQDAAQALCFLLPRTKRPRYLNGHISIGQVDREVRHFANHQPLEFAAAKLIVELFALDSLGASSQEASFQVAVTPRRRRAWISAVMRKTGAGSKCTSS